MPQLFDQLREFLSEVENEKQASVKKRAAANTEPGSQGGATSHPSKDVDDSTQPASEGQRSQENTSDVKKTIFNGGVDSASDNSPSQEDQQLNVGITSTSTGEDPSNEDNYKGDKEDPGTTHPAKASEGEKYSSMNFGSLRALTEKKANDLLADIAAHYNNKEAESKMPPFILDKMKQKKKDNPSAKMEATSKAASAGEAAASLSNEQHAEIVKQAQEAVAGSIESTIFDGLEKAAMVGSYLTEFVKAAEGEAAAPEGESEESGEEEAAEESEGGMDVDPSMMSQMAGEGAAPEGGASPDDAAQELLMALQEQGIDPAELLAMIQGGGAPAEGGAPPMDPAMAGGAPPMDPAMMDPAMMGGMPPEAAKMASANRAVTKDLVNLVKYAQHYRKAGKFKFTEAKTAQQRNLRDQIKLCVRDIIG
jgi:hypothetical protein